MAKKPLLTAALCMACISSAFAQTWPNKPIKVVVPYPAGGAADITAKAVPDGYTLLLDASGPLVVNPALYAKVTYDTERDFIPISQTTTFQYVLVVPEASPINSVSELAAAI